MPPTRTTKTKAKPVPSPVVSRTTETVKKPRQRKAKGAVEGNTAPVDPTEPDAIAPTPGRTSRKKPAAIPTSATAEEPLLAQPAAGKRRRQLTGGVEEESDNQPVKRSKATAANPDETLPKRGRGRPRKDAQLPPARSPLPDRLVRNTHPATPKGTRRSSEQVAADDAAKRAAERKLLEEQIRLGEMAKLQFAQMQIGEEQADAEVQKKNATRLSAVIRRREPVKRKAESDDGEDFDFDEVDDLSSSGCEDLVVQPVRKRKVSCDQWACIASDKP